MSYLKRALSTRKPEIINSDQGSHFTNPDYLSLLEGENVRISMDGKGQALAIYVHWKHALVKYRK